MSIGHEIIQYARGKKVEPDGQCLHSAPITMNANNNRPRVLDLGCGEGNWVLDMAEWVGIARVSQNTIDNAPF